MNGYEIAIGAAVTVILSFWGWLAVKVIAMGSKLVELEARIEAREHECQARVAWIRNIELKINSVSEDTAAIRGALGVPKQ